MLPEITIIHSFIAIYCQSDIKNIELSNASRNYHLSIALLQFTLKTVLKSFHFQLLIEIIHCFIAISCQNGTKNILLSNASRNYNYPLPYCSLLSKRYLNHFTFKLF